MSETCVGVNCCPVSLYPSGFTRVTPPSPVTASGTSFALLSITIPEFAAAYGDCTFELLSSGDGREPPNGMYLDENTGVISGQPTEVGTFDLTVLIADAYGNSQITQVLITITAGTPPDEPDGIGLGNSTVGVAFGDPTAGVILGEPQ